jgi:hypothetical protein
MAKMLIRVMYKDYRYDYVSAGSLDRLIAAMGIIKFLRPSEDRWIDIARGPVRGAGGPYAGLERRSAFAS